MEHSGGQSQALKGAGGGGGGLGGLRGVIRANPRDAGTRTLGGADSLPKC